MKARNDVVREAYALLQLASLPDLNVPKAAPHAHTAGATIVAQGREGAVRRCGTGMRGRSCWRWTSSSANPSARCVPHEGLPQLSAPCRLARVAPRSDCHRLACSLAAAAHLGTPVLCRALAECSAWGRPVEPEPPEDAPGRNAEYFLSVPRANPRCPRPCLLHPPRATICTLVPPAVSSPRVPHPMAALGRRRRPRGPSLSSRSRTCSSLARSRPRSGCMPRSTA